MHSRHRALIVVSVFAATIPFATTSSSGDAFAASRHCDGRSGEQLEVHCESTRPGAVTRRGPRRPATTLEVRLFDTGEGARACTIGGQDGMFMVHVRRTLDGRQVSNRLRCHSLSPSAPPTPSHTAVVTWWGEQRSDASVWPALTIGIDPGARGLVGLRYALAVDGAATITAGPIALADGTQAIATAYLRGVSWWIDDSLVASATGDITPRRADIAYVWSTSGAKTIEVVSIWDATVNAVYPDGTTEELDLDPVELVITTTLDVEQVQSVIDYAG
jgi:hypothetical protein